MHHKERSAAISSSCIRLRLKPTASPLISRLVSIISSTEPEESGSESLSEVKTSAQTLSVTLLGQSPSGYHSSHACILRTGFFVPRLLNGFCDQSHRIP